MSTVAPNTGETTAATVAEYAVAGMSCGHCETAIREEVAKIAPVKRIDVSAATGRLAVTADAPLDDAAVLAAVDEAGYEAVRIR